MLGPSRYSKYEKMMAQTAKRSQEGHGLSRGSGKIELHGFEADAGRPSPPKVFKRCAGAPRAHCATTGDSGSAVLFTHLRI